jgi:hypothetical protein
MASVIPALSLQSKICLFGTTELCKLRDAEPLEKDYPIVESQRSIPGNFLYSFPSNRSEGRKGMSRSRSTLDNELIREFKAGDTRAFEAIVVRYQKPIVNFIYRMIGDFQEAEDMAQEVFIKIYRFAHTYNHTRRNDDTPV